MSRDWFDPFGLRGSRLDPFVIFTNALTGQGPVGQSAEVLATTLARRVVGRTVRIDGAVDIEVTVDAVDEARPPAPLSAIPTGAVEVPMWERVRLRLREIRIDRWRIASVDIDGRDIRLVGVGAQAISVGATEFVATVRFDELQRWAAAIDGDRHMRVVGGRIEVSDRRLRGWVWVDIDVTARDRTVIVTPRSLRAFGRAVVIPSRLRRTVSRSIPSLPETLVVDEVTVEGDVVLIGGSLSRSIFRVDLARVLADLGTEGSMSVLRIVTGGR